MCVRAVSCLIDAELQTAQCHNNTILFNTIYEKRKAKRKSEEKTKQNTKTRLFEEKKNTDNETISSRRNDYYVVI